MSPWGKIKGFHFDSSPEDDHFMYEFKKDIDEKNWEENKPDGKVHVGINSQNKERFFEVKNLLSDINSDVKCFSLSTKDPEAMDDGIEDVDEKKEEPSKTDPKKKKS